MEVLRGSNGRAKLRDTPHENCALRQLNHMGYRLELLPTEEGEAGVGDWFAENEDVELFASSPLALLGLAVAWERRHDLDSAELKRDLFDELLSAAYPGDNE